MHITIIDGDVSYPATSGKRLRTLNLMMPLAERHQLTYIARSSNIDRDRSAVAFLADHGVETVLVDDPIAGKQGALFYGRLAANVASPLPYSVASHTTTMMREAVQRHAANRQVDLWQLEWAGYHYCIDQMKAPVVLQAHNVDALIWQRYFETERRPLHRWYIGQQFEKFRRFEMRVFQSVTRVVAVSAADAALAVDLYGKLPIDVVDNGVDIESYSGVRPDPQSRTILFLGALDWRPNIDAVTLMLDEIFPALRVAAPDASLAIVGRNPPDWLRAKVKAANGVTLHADVPDVKPYLALSAVMVVPLRIGGGTRLKILESLAAGLPVVATSVGAEGLNLTPGLDLTIADTPRDIAAALAQCLSDPASAARQAEHGRKTVAAQYDWKILSDRLAEVWEIAAASHDRKAIPQSVGAAR